MTTSRSVPCDFPQASVLLHNLVLQIESDIAQFNKSSSEMMHTLREKMTRTWEEWPAIKSNFATAVNNLPKELRKRDFVRTALTEAERFEENARHFFARLSESHALTSRPHAWETLGQHRAKLIEHSNRLSAHMTAIRSHPLVEKFQRGEPILASRSKIQWGRKLGHMACGLSFLFLFAFSGLPDWLIMTLFAAFTLWAVSLETARHLSPRVNAWVCKAFRPVMREREKNKINSAMYFLTAMTLVYLIFPRDVAVLTMLFISLGDPIAGIIGCTYGKHRLSKHASVEGVVACFTMCALLAFVAGGYLFTDYALSGGALFVFAILAGLTGAAAESSLKKLDDNLVMPLLSAPGIWFLVNWLGQ